MKLVLRLAIVLSLIAVALAISWYPWREPDVDIGVSRTVTPPEDPPPAASEPQVDRPNLRADRSGRGKPQMSVADRKLADEVVKLVNAERAKARCPAVVPDPKLTEAALAHSDDMARRGYFSHNAPDGADPWQRASAAGYQRPTGENIAIGYPDARAVMSGWLASPGHRATIVNCNSRALGVGLARNAGGTPYWTQLFGA